MADGVRATTARTVVPRLLLGKTGPVLQDGLMPPAPSARSVPLNDLLLIAVLTPAQATLVAAELLEAAGAPDAPTGRVNALVTAEGAVELAERGTGDTHASLPELLDEIVRSARRLPAHPRPHQLWLLQRLEEQVGVIGQPIDRAEALREALTEVLGVGGATKVRGEVAVLVDAFGDIAIPKHAAGEAEPSAVPSPSWSVRPHGNPARQYGVGRRRMRPRHVLIGLVVLAVALGGGYLLLRGPASGLLDFLPGGSHPSSAQGNPPAKPHPKHHRGHPKQHRGGTVPALAALSSGRVQSVEMQPTSSCRPGATCGVQVTVHITPASASQVVSWRVGVVKGCTKHVTWSPVTGVTALPGWTRVYSTSSVQVPKGNAFSLVALTSAPAHAQSRPVPVAGAVPHC